MTEARTEKITAEWTNPRMIRVWVETTVETYKDFWVDYNDFVDPQDPDEYDAARVYLDSITDPDELARKVYLEGLGFNGLGTTNQESVEHEIVEAEFQ